MNGSAVSCPDGFVHAGDARLCAPLSSTVGAHNQPATTCHQERQHQEEQDKPAPRTLHIGQRGVLQRRSKACDINDDVLLREDGLLLPVKEEASRPAGLLAALRRLTAKEHIHVGFQVVELSEECVHLRLDIFFPTRVLTYGWRPSPAAAVLFRALTTPPDCAVCCVAAMGGSNDGSGSGDERFSLAGIFRELKMKVTVEGVEPIAAADDSAHSGLGCLPVEALRRVAASLTDMRDMCALGATCRGLRALTRDQVPGVQLTLYPHQRAAVQWMRSREAQPTELEHPFVKRFATVDGMLPFYGCLATGRVTPDPPPPVFDVRGGMFCDEPGLGKTITALALLLSSPGRLPEPPAGAKVLSAADPVTGRPRCWYIARDSECVSGSALSSPAGRQSRRRTSERRLGRQNLATSPALGSDPPSGAITHPSSPGPLPQPTVTPAELPTPATVPVPTSPSLSTPIMNDSTLDGRPSPECAPFRSPLSIPVHDARPGVEEQVVPLLQGRFTTMPKFRHPRFTKKMLVASAPPAIEKRRRTAESTSPASIGSGRDEGGMRHAGGSPFSLSPAEITAALRVRMTSQPLVSSPTRRGNEQKARAPFIPQADLTQCPPGRIPASGKGHVQGVSEAALKAQQAANVSYFCSLFEGHGELMRGEPEEMALLWLAGISPSGLKQLLERPEGLQVPSKYWATPYPEIFLKLGLERRDTSALPSSAPQRKDRVSSGRKKRRKSAGEALQREAHTWGVSGEAATGWQLDTEALREALKLMERVEKVCMSSATLVVVPPTLIQHWLQQIDAHIQPGRLRVCELSDHTSAETLAWDYDLVLTTFQKLSNEWRNTSARRLSGRGVGGSTTVLTRIHWQRVILDEGHMLGQSLGITSKLAMATALKAGSRWVMTGTPTPSKASTVDVSHLQPLLGFLHQTPYGLERGAWEDAIQRPVHARDETGRARLLDVLQRIMIRASKADLRTIPPCKHRVTTLRFAPQHAASYNQLVEVIRRNLLLADWNDEDHNESLLSTTSKKWATEMIDNVRKSCCVAGNCNLEVQERDLQETVELLAERLGLPPPSPWSDDARLPWVPLEHPLAEVENKLRYGGSCDRCGSPLRMPIVTPCGHTLCTDCLQPSPHCCPLANCGRPYRMQPVDDPARKKNNPNPKWEVPHEVIEWQPAYAQRGAVGVSGGEWSATWEVTNSSKCIHMLTRLREMGVIGADGNMPVPSLMDAFSEKRTRQKAIVFSQFWMHIKLAARHLAAHGVVFCALRGGMTPYEKAASLNRFQKDPQVGVLLMDESGSVGLDLSFVSYVLMLEPIADLSMEEQVVSRAHRMGAVAPILVETLLMHGTAEEEMFWLQRQMSPPPPHLSPDSTVCSSLTFRYGRQSTTDGSDGNDGSGGRGEVPSGTCSNKTIHALGGVLLRHLHNVVVPELPQIGDRG